MPAYFLGKKKALKGGSFDVVLRQSSAMMLLFVMVPAKSIVFMEGLWTEGLLIAIVITKSAGFKIKKHC